MRGWFVLVLILLMLLIGLQQRIWFGHGGFKDVQRLENAIAAQKIENEKLRRRNEQLAAEVEDLKRGKEAVEERARNEMGMVKPGEIFYQVIDKPKTVPPAGQTP
jgi:cell division protein FtsB